jgi:regulator of protease activity HflC (stomatin/prohibitin superfamily)
MELTGKKIVGIGAGAIVFFVVVGLLIAGIRTVDEGYVGIKKVFGEAQDEALTPGLHIINPFTDDIVTTETRAQKLEAGANAGTKDLQTVSTTVAVNFEVPGGTAVQLYKQWGADYSNRLISPAIQEAVKRTTAKFSAEELVTKREAVKAEIEDSLSKTVFDNTGIVVKNVFTTDFSFDPSYQAKITEAQNARKQLETEQNNLLIIQKKAEQAVAEAEGKRDSDIALAEGQKESQILRAQGEAESVKLINEQLRASPEYIQYIQAQRWNGQLPTFVGGGDIPFILNMGDLEKKAE